MEAENRANPTLTKDQALRCPNCLADAIARRGIDYFCLDCNHALGSDQTEKKVQDHESTPSTPD